MAFSERSPLPLQHRTTRPIVLVIAAGHEMNFMREYGLLPK